MALSKVNAYNPGADQIARRTNDLVDTVVNQVGAISTSTGDLGQLSTAINGNLSFGNTSKTGNIKGKLFSTTTPSSANTEFSITHNLGAVPTGYIVFYVSSAAIVYEGPTTGTAWTSSTIYLKCNAGSVNILLFITIP